MGSFGEQLKHERERRGITLDEISLSTKISTRLLRALEADHFDQLPGGIFNKGFVRAYARHLGIDEDQAVADYLAALNQHPGSIADANAPLDNNADGKPARPAPPAPHEREPAPESVFSVLRAQFAPERVEQVPWSLMAGLLLLVALLFAGWSYFRRDQRAETPKSTTPAASEALPPQSSAPQLSTPAPEPSVQKVTPVPTPVTQEAGLKQPVASPPPADAQPRLASAMATPRPAAAPDVPGAFAVTLEAQDEDCWLLINVDDQPAVEETLFAPGKQTLHANRSLVIKAGDVGALDIFFNGKRIPAQGDFGEVRTLTFRSDGLQAPAPRAPAAAQ